jgi:membrane-associated HD superfamily phosphohydrolase
MLADGAEARVRAANPRDEDELREIIQEAIEHAQQSGQLDNTQLTLRDLSTIADSFVTTLRGTFHPRIEYPKAENAAAVQNISTTSHEEINP